MIYYIVLLLMTVIGSFASLFLKFASKQDNIKSLLLNKNIYIGGTLYVLSALMNIYVLKFLDYSVVLPLTSLTYVWNLFISNKVLKERITKNKVIGIGLIVVGVILITL